VPNRSDMAYQNAISGGLRLDSFQHCGEVSTQFAAFA
jgi:hypothetical protein